MKRIIVLGSGNMGSYIASNLSDDYDVTVADCSQSNFDKITKENIHKTRADLSKPDVVKELVSGFDLAVCALPESLGYDVLKAVVISGINTVDISFWRQSRERFSDIESLANRNNVTVLIDCGVAPGLSNAIVSHFDALLDGRTKSAAIYVGGIPADRERQFFLTWSINGIFEEYRRKALRVRDGMPEKVEALSSIENIDFSGVGELEAGITDGLRTLPYNLPHVISMSEFTLRYPGYFHQMKILSELGYFDEELVEMHTDAVTAADVSNVLMKSKDSEKYEAVLDRLGFLDNDEKYECAGKSVSPRKIASCVLSKTWEKKSEDRDLLVMRISADNGKNGYEVDLFAKHNGTDSAMAITTGGMAVLGTKAVAEKLFDKKGVFPLENVVKKSPEMMQYFINGMKRLGVKYEQRKK